MLTGKRKFLAILAAIAFIVAVSGIDKFHSNPFTFTFATDNPTACVTNETGQPCAIADQSGSVLLIMDDNGQLAHSVKVDNANNPHDRITMLHVEGDAVYANVVTIEGQHIVREQIRQYDKHGKCVRTISNNAYSDGSVFMPRNQSFVGKGKELSVVHLESNTIKTLSLHREAPSHSPRGGKKVTGDRLQVKGKTGNQQPTTDNLQPTIDSVNLGEPLIEAQQVKDSSLYVIGLYGKVYRYVPGSGSAQAVRLSSKGYQNIMLNEPKVIETVEYSPLYAAANILFWLSLLFIGVVCLTLAYRFVRHKYNKTIGIAITIVLLSVGIVAFYTYNIFEQTKSQTTQMMGYQTELLAYVTEHNYMGLLQTLSTEDMDSSLMQSETMKQLTDLHTILEKSSRFDGNEYYVAIVYNKDSIARQLVDNMNLLSTGQPAQMHSLKWDSPSTDGTDVITAFNEELIYTVRNVTDQAGKIVAKIVSVIPDQLLRSAQKEKSFGLLLSLVSILIGIYTLFTFANAIRHSVSEYIRRRRASLPYAREHLFPTFYSLIIWFREVDRSLMVFIIPYFAIGGSIGDVASITAMVLMIYSLGSIVMVPFTKVAYTRFGPRAVGIAASFVNLLSYVLMVVALKSTEVNLFYFAKFLSGASAGNVLTVVSHSLGASVKDQAARTELFNDKQTVANTINVLAILLSGYIIQYLNPVVLYAVAILLSALLIGISALTLSKISEDGSRPTEDSPRWRDMVASFKFFVLRDGICVVFFVLLPVALFFGYLDFIFPVYASECGITPLMLSNIMVIGLALNLMLRKPLNDYYASIGTRKALIVQTAFISVSLLLLAVSPNIIWMIIICLIIYVLKMNSCVVLYQVEMIERNGFRQQEVQSDCVLADQILRTVRMPFINMLVQAGRVSASIWIGFICACLTGGLVMFGKDKIKKSAANG